MYSLVFYSHFDYSDVWPLLFKQTDKYYPNHKKYLFTNKANDLVPEGWIVVKYDENLSYQKRVFECLKSVEEEILIFSHEDMVLYAEPDYIEIEKLSKLLKISDIDIIKLIRAEYTQEPYRKQYLYNNVYENPYNLYFAIQPSLCKKNKLSKIYEDTGGKTIWEFESESSRTALVNRIKSCMYYRGTENKKGLYHWDSEIYPYIATAIVKGKWNFESYEEILTKMLNELNIDKNIRGCV